MFHHFHDNKKHIKSQGSINAKQFEKLINCVGVNNILPPHEFIKKLRTKKLKKNHLCLTFDDSLKCQFDIAFPVMEKFNLKAFFFVTSSTLTQNSDKLELYRYFRHKFYSNMNQFYKDFFNMLSLSFKKINIKEFLNSKKKLIQVFKKKHPMYTKNDIEFRMIRDRLINKKMYEFIMLKMFKKKRFNYKKKIKELYLSKDNIKSLSSSGNEIGLHSHTHPTMFENLNQSNQKKEYQLNKKILEKLINKKILSMSHPSGSYNQKTLKILKNIGIKIGFKQIMTKDRNMKKINNSTLEIARANHSEIIRKHKIN